MIEIIVPGDPGYIGTCITADTRPDPSHAWARAANHIFKFKDLNYHVQLAAAAKCWRVAGCVLPLGRPRPGPVVKWGWGKGWPGIR